MSDYAGQASPINDRQRCRGKRRSPVAVSHMDEPRKSVSHRFESTRVVVFGTERPLVFSEFPEQGISPFRIERDLLFRHSGPPLHGVTLN
jgi:hypothetical protein